MDTLFTSGRIADLMVVVIGLEMLALAWHRQAVWQRAWPGLCAGLGLALALRGALTGAGWPWLAGWLSLSGVAHGVDVFRRWRH